MRAADRRIGGVAVLSVPMGTAEHTVLATLRWVACLLLLAALVVVIADWARRR